MIVVCSGEWRGNLYEQIYWKVQQGQSLKDLLDRCPDCRQRYLSVAIRILENYMTYKEDRWNNLCDGCHSNFPTSLGICSAKLQVPEKIASCPCRECLIKVMCDKVCPTFEKFVMERRWNVDEI